MTFGQHQLVTSRQPAESWDKFQSFHHYIRVDRERIKCRLPSNFVIYIRAALAYPSVSDSDVLNNILIGHIYESSKS